MEIERLGAERMGFDLRACSVVWAAPSRTSGLGLRSPHLGCRRRGFSRKPLGVTRRGERDAPPRPGCWRLAQPQPPSISSRSPARACCPHPTEALTASYPGGSPLAQGNRPTSSFLSENGLQGPRLLPTVSGLWTGRRLGSAVVWAKFNLSHARGHRSGLLCPAKGSRALLTFT